MTEINVNGLFAGAMIFEIIQIFIFCVTLYNVKRYG